MIINIILITLLFLLTIILFLKVYISEDKRYKIYERMEDDFEKKIENKSGVYKFIYVIVFHLF